MPMNTDSAAAIGATNCGPISPHGVSHSLFGSSCCRVSIGWNVAGDIFWDVGCALQAVAAVSWSGQPSHAVSEAASTDVHAGWHSCAMHGIGGT